MSQQSKELTRLFNDLVSFQNIGDEAQDEQGWNITIKILSIVVILSITVMFGFFPYFCSRCRKSVKILGLANAFSGGIFMGIAMFHLLPESIENIEKYYKPTPDAFLNKIPFAFFLAFGSYSLILFVEKIAFDSHALIEHDHGDHDEHEAEHHDHDHTQELKSKKDSKKGTAEEKLISPQAEESEDSDEEEEAMKNVVSSRGKFASFLHMRNSIIEKQTRSFAEISPKKKDKALTRASMILTRTLGGGEYENENEDMKFMVNPHNVHVDDKEKSHQHAHPSASEFKPKSNITPFLLLIALSLHGFFEGIALGIQGAVKDTLFLFIAIISHKWAEAFTLGISFTKANTEKKTFIWLIIIFAAFTPFGIGLGLILSGSSKLIEGIILAISTGTFIYVAASEVIVEEFAVTKYRYSKFFLYLVGGVFVGLLAVMEKLYGDED